MIAPTPLTGMRASGRRACGQMRVKKKKEKKKDCAAEPTWH